MNESNSLPLLALTLGLSLGCGSGGSAAGNGGTASSLDGSGGSSGAKTTAGATSSTGGASTGGASTGGTSSGGASTGGTSSGGASTGGTSSGGASTGGTSNAGSAGTSGGPGSSCGVTTTACSAPTVTVTEIDVGSPVAVNEDDAALRILSISPIPSGGSRLAWMDKSNAIYVTTLDACDKVDALHPTFKIAGFDYGDIFADNAGGVMLVTRAAKGADPKYCGTIQNLCGNVSSLPTQYSCWDMYLVRFDGSSETWATQLSKSTAALPPYLNSATDSSHAFYIWQAYAHHGRLAYDGTNYAGYYGAAQSVGNQKCAQTDSSNVNGVDIHQGDEMMVVGPTGTLLTGHNSFDWGCSHSGFEKILWDPAANRYVTICRSDAYPHVGLNVNAANLVYAIDPANSSLSNLALASDGGYWILVSNTSANDLLLLKFSTGTATSNISLGTGTKPHLVRYGSRLLATWNTGTSMVGQLLDAASGAKIGATFAIAATNNQFSDFREYVDGSVAYPAQGSSANKIKIVRMWPCQ